MLIVCHPPMGCREKLGVAFSLPKLSGPGCCTHLNIKPLSPDGCSAVAAAGLALVHVPSLLPEVTGACCPVAERGFGSRMLKKVRYACSEAIKGDMGFKFPTHNERGGSHTTSRSVSGLCCRCKVLAHTSMLIPCT